MTRVEEDRDVQRIEDQRRLEDSQRSKKKEANEQFQKMVAQKQANAQGDATRQGQRQAQAKQQGQAAAKNSASAALMARQGIQSHALTAALQKRGESSVQKASVDAKNRREEITEDKARVTDRQERIKEDDRHDPLAAISRDGRREEGAGTDAGGGGAGGMDMGGQQQPGIGQPAAVAEAQQTSGPQGPRISPELIQQLVNRVYAGVTPEGLSQFSIELRNDVLGGARLDVVAKDGKISCTFHTGDKNVGRLLKASEGALARAFGHKGLTLERLEVVER